MGLGGYFKGQWFQGRWPHHLLLNREWGISIEWQELFPIVVACTIWHPHFAGKRLQLWCDNELVVAIINSGHSKVPRIMDLLRALIIISMKHNFFIRARHVPGVHNVIADALSRFQEARFRGSCSHGGQGPLHHPAFANDPLRDEVFTYARWSLAWTTQRTYSSGEKSFITFCLMNRLAPDRGIYFQPLRAPLSTLPPT